MTRYYDPKTGRFINADTPDYLDPETLGGLNLYAYCNNKPVLLFDPNGHFSWFALAVAIAVVSVIVNIAVVVESEIYVANNDVEPMSKERYDEINKADQTYGLSREDKLAYIRAYMNDPETDSSKWSEAEMLREFEYHDRGYELVILLGSDPNEKGSFANRFKYVNFEENPNWQTLVYRYIGNLMFW